MDQRKIRRERKDCHIAARAATRTEGTFRKLSAGATSRARAEAVHCDTGPEDHRDGRVGLRCPSRTDLQTFCRRRYNDPGRAWRDSVASALELENFGGGAEQGR